jgi:hypothetical protein
MSSSSNNDLEMLKNRYESSTIPAETKPQSTVIFKKLLDLPPIPQHIIDLCIEKYNSREYFPENHGSYKQRVLKNWKGKYNGAVGRIQRGQVSDEFDNWAREHIGPGFHEAGVGWIDVKPETPPSIGGHTDRTRSAVVGYNIFPGGPNAEITFWRERGHDYLRTTRGLSFENDRDLEPVYSTRDWTGCWYWLNPQVIHGLENITEPYMDITVDYNVLPEKIRRMLEG